MGLFNNLKTVLSTSLLTEHKLNDYDMLINSKLENDLEYNNFEEGLTNYFLNMNQEDNFCIDKKVIQKIKESLKVSTIEEEKEYFTKLFMRDYQSRYNDRYKISDTHDMSTIFRNFASEELKNDEIFTEVILKLDGKYLKGMNDNVRSSKEMVFLAIDNDTSEKVYSFVCALEPAQTDYQLALKYLKKLKENNAFVTINSLYENIFKKNMVGNFTDKIFKNNVQNKWLSNKQFMIELIQFNPGFVSYIVDGKISMIEIDNSRKELKK